MLRPASKTFQTRAWSGVDRCSGRARRRLGTTVNAAIVSLGRIVDGLAMEPPPKVADALLARGLPHI